jgi:hypothetical protein
MRLTTKDKVALPVAILLGAAFGYFSMLAGYGGLLIDGFYGIVVVPLVVLFVAGQKKMLVWQACIVPAALWVVVANARLGPLGIALGFQVFFVFWTLETVISSPVPIFLYWKRSRERAGHQVAWFFLGLVFVGMICSLWRDPFLFFGFALAWIVLCLVKFAWEWRRGAEPHAKAAALVALLALVLAVSGAVLIGFFFNQRAFHLAINHHHLRVARLLVSMGADPNARDAVGETALVDAVWSGVGDLDAVNALISTGANINQEQGGALHGMLPSGTALHVAAYAGRTGICQSLLRAGASVDAKNQRGETPLLVALSRGTIACVPALLDYGAAVNARDMQDRTALMFLMNYAPDDPAVQKILRELLTKGADVNARDADGKTAEDWATYYKHEQFAEQLRRLQESINKDNRELKSR